MSVCFSLNQAILSKTKINFNWIELNKRKLRVWIRNKFFLNFQFLLPCLIYFI